MAKEKNILLGVTDCYVGMTDFRRLTSCTALAITNTTDQGPPCARPIHTLVHNGSLTARGNRDGGRAVKQLAPALRAHKVNSRIQT